MKYAKATKVSPEKSLTEIKQLLDKYGATKFAYMQDSHQVALAFVLCNKNIRFRMSLPARKEFEKTETGQWRSENSIENAHKQGVRQRYRALALCIKAKLESVSTGIETFEEAFMAHIVMPNGQIFSEWALPQIEESYQNNKMPPLLGH